MATGMSAHTARTAARIVLAGVGGAVVGVAAYAVSQTGGQLLSTVVGALVGVAVAVGLSFYRKSVQLAEVNVAVLGSTLTFTATADMRQAAQSAYFQAATRIATRPLDDGTGNLREALTSLKTLFDLYREPLESPAAPLPSPQGDTVHELLVEILNNELAPFLATWHPRLAGWEASRPDADEDAWPENAAFREELRQLQLRLRPYVVGLGRIAGLRDPERHLPRPGRTGTAPATGTGTDTSTSTGTAPEREVPPQQTHDA